MPPADDFEQEMLQLEVEIRRLEAEYNMFFAGRLPRPPWETRARVDALVKRYDRTSLLNTAARFRFGTLQARYVSFCQLWERTLKTREEGRPHGGPRGSRAPESAAQPSTVPAPHEPTGASGEAVLYGASLRDPKRESDRMRELYEHLSDARREAGEPPVPYHRFAEVVRAQISKLGGGETDVAFRVAVKNGKVTLTAEPVKEE